MSLANRARIKLAQLDSRWKNVRFYQMVKAQSRAITLTLSVLLMFALLKFSLPVTYIDTNRLTKLNRNSSTTIAGLYDFFGPEVTLADNAAATDNGIEPKYVFITNKYPAPIVYQSILNDFAPEEFHKKDLKTKCETYFTRLYEMDPDWSLQELESGYPYNRFIFDTKKQFMEERRNNYKKELEEEGIEFPEEGFDEKLDKLIEERNKNYEWEINYEKAFQESYDTETYMSNCATHLRVFHQCYLDDIPTEQQVDIDKFSNQITCGKTEKKLFKFLTGKFPKFVRWNGETLEYPPVMQDYLNDVKYVTKKSAKFQSCFVRDLKESYNGQGIVISAADKHVDELSSLLLVLRALNNTLPIQIVHRGDLSEESQKALTLVSRSVKLNLDRVKNFMKYIQHHFTNVKDLDIASIFPPQEIWYVDATQSINPDDRRFITYGNKLLTLLFSSFEDTVLLDTDTVPFVDIKKHILQSDVYKDTQAFFFKDRQLYDRMSGPELTYFKKLLPTRLDTAFFGIPELTDYTMKNRFFGDKYKHIQESGMVAINKKRHFRGTLMINMLQMWSAATERVHGDKELFWLGFSIAGDEDYYLNKYGVGAVGNINPNSNRLLGDSNDDRRSKLKSHMLCTTHPAHLSGVDDHTLLWMNSGFITCKREDEAEKDISLDLYKNIFKSAEELKKTYVGPQKISAILVPPPQERIINNELGEPASGWEVMFGCGGYLYCAFDNIGGSDDPYYHGTLVEYDQEEQLLFDYLGELWVDYEKVIKN